MTDKIKLEDWDYECGDGCCYDWGTYLVINEENVGTYYGDTSLIELLAKHYNLDIEVEW